MLVNIQYKLKVMQQKELLNMFFLETFFEKLNR